MHSQSNHDLLQMDCCRSFFGCICHSCYSSLQNTCRNKNYVDDTCTYKKSVNINLAFDNMSPEQITAFRELLKDLSPSQIKALFCGQQIIEIERQQKRSPKEKDRG